MPLHSDVHIDRPLSNFAVEYQNLGFIAGQVVPFVPVNNKSDSYFIYTKADKFSIPEDVRGPKAKASEVTWGSSSASYGCIDRALRDFLSDGVVANSDPGVNPQQRTTGFLTDLLLLNFERRIATLVNTYTNYAAGCYTTLSGTTQLSDYANSDPIGVIDTAKAACFVDPNVMVMSRTVYDKLKRHPALLDHIKGGATTSNPALVGIQQMAEIFGVDRILIGKAKYNSSIKGQTATYADIWGKYISLLYVDPNPSLDGVSFAKTFRWRQMTTDLPYKVRRYRDEELGGGGEWIEVEMSVTEKVVCSDVGYLIIDAVA